MYVAIAMYVISDHICKMLGRKQKKKYIGGVGEDFLYNSANIKQNFYCVCVFITFNQF